MGGAAMKPHLDERETHETGDTLPDQAGVYVPPRPIPSLSDHRTMDVKAIRIAAEHDPRQALTQLRMQPPPRRRSSTLLIGTVSAAVGLGAVLYFGLMAGRPLPLVTSSGASSTVPAPEVTAASTETVTALAPALTPSVPPASPAPTALPSEPPLPAVTAPPSVASTAAARAPIIATKRAAPPAAHAKRGAAPAAKVRRDPWLE
jgi:hypothetical protein